MSEVFYALVLVTTLDATSVSTLQLDGSFASFNRCEEIRSKLTPPAPSRYDGKPIKDRRFPGVRHFYRCVAHSR